MKALKNPLTVQKNSVRIKKIILFIFKEDFIMCKIIRNFLFFGVILIALSLFACDLGVDNTVTYTPQTEAGKTLQKTFEMTVTHTENAMNILGEYSDFDLDTMKQGAGRSAAENQKLEEDLRTALLSLTGKETRQRMGRNGVTEIVTLEQELDELELKVGEAAKAIAPDVTELVEKASWIEQGPDKYSIIVDGDQVIRADNPSGAMQIEFLKAQLRGEDVEKIVEDTKKTAQSLSNANDSGAGRGFYDNGTTRWKNNEVVYYFPTGTYKREKEAVLEAMRDWQNKTDNEIYFRQATGYEIFWAGRQSLFAWIFWWIVPTKVVEITTNDQWLLGENTGGFVTNIGGGVSSLGPSRMQIRAGLDDVQLKRTTRHELGHILGLQHEHQRPDRDEYITMDLTFWDGLLDINRKKLDFYSTNWHFKWVKIQGYFSISLWWGGSYRIPYTIWVPMYIPEVVNNNRATDYDYFSIMHYHSGTWKAKREQSAIMTIKGVNDNQPSEYKISKGEVMNFIYKRRNGSIYYSDWYGEISPLDAKIIKRMY